VNLVRLCLCHLQVNLEVVLVPPSSESWGCACATFKRILRLCLCHLQENLARMCLTFASRLFSVAIEKTVKVCHIFCDFDIKTV
jgi:hypothetical protein